jgi:hypothetical protein
MPLDSTVKKNSYARESPPVPLLSVERMTQVSFAIHPIYNIIISRNRFPSNSHPRTRKLVIIIGGL